MPENRPAHTSGRALKRRSVVAAAWSVPVIAIGTAAPARAASAGGFDVALDSPQMGSGVVMYDADFTRIYTVDEPMAWVVSNHGAEPAPGGFPMSVTCDNRIWKVTSVTGGFGSDRANLPVTRTVSDGTSTTVTFTIPEVIPPGTDSYTGYRVNLSTDFLGAYPHDGITPAPTVTRWEVTPPAGDTSAADNVVQYQSYRDDGAASIWGAIVTRLAGQSVPWPDGSTLNRPTRVEVTSIGPQPTPGGSRIFLGTDARMSSDISVTDVTVNGVASAILTKGTSTVYQGSSLRVPFALTRGLAADEVLRFDISYADEHPTQTPSDPDAGQTDFNPPDSELNSPNQRAQERSYFNN